MSCPKNALYKSVIPAGAKTIIPTEAKRSGGTLGLQQPIPFTWDFPCAIISGR